MDLYPELEVRGKEAGAREERGPFPFGLDLRLSSLPILASFFISGAEVDARP